MTKYSWGLLFLALTATSSYAGEADIKIPDLNTVRFNVFGSNLSGMAILYGGLIVCALGVVYGLLSTDKRAICPCTKRCGQSRISFGRPAKPT